MCHGRGDEDPFTATDLGDPLSVGCVLREMIDMNFDTRTCA